MLFQLRMLEINLGKSRQTTNWLAQYENVSYIVAERAGYVL